MKIAKPKNFIVLSVSVLLMACGNDISRLSDDDLRHKIQECDYALDMTAAEHQICDNYHRECKRRFDEGRFVCQ